MVCVRWRVYTQGHFSTHITQVEGRHGETLSNSYHSVGGCTLRDTSPLISLRLRVGTHGHFPTHITQGEGVHSGTLLHSYHSGWGGHTGILPHSCHSLGGCTLNDTSPLISLRLRVDTQEHFPTHFTQMEDVNTGTLPEESQSGWGCMHMGISILLSFSRRGTNSETCLLMSLGLCSHLFPSSSLQYTWHVWQDKCF